MQCEFCGHEFSTIKYLRQHQRLAKYCLALQDLDSEMACGGCGIKFNKKTLLNKHVKDCMAYSVKEKYENRIKELLHQLEEKDKMMAHQLAEKDKTIARLEKIIEKAACKSTVTNTQINNLIPTHFEEQAKYLTIEHIKNGAQGFAKYAVDYPLKDRVMCVDYSRRKVRYKNSDGDVINDPEMTELTKKLFTACESRNAELIKKCRGELYDVLLRRNQSFDDEMTDEETNLASQTNDEIFKVIETLTKCDTDVHEIAIGLKPEMCSEFVKEVCSQISKK